MGPKWKETTKTKNTEEEGGREMVDGEKALGPNGSKLTLSSQSASPASQIQAEVVPSSLLRVERSTVPLNEATETEAHVGG